MNHKKIELLVKGDHVNITSQGETARGVVIAASPDSVSLMIVIDRYLTFAMGSKEPHFIGLVPFTLEKDGYHELLTGSLVTLEKVKPTPNAAVVIYPNGQTDVQPWTGRLDAQGMPAGKEGREWLEKLLGGHNFEVVAASWDGQKRYAFRIGDENLQEGLRENIFAQTLLTADYHKLAIVGPMLIWIPAPPEVNSHS